MISTRMVLILGNIKTMKNTEIGRKNPNILSGIVVVRSTSLLHLLYLIYSYSAPIIDEISSDEDEARAERLVRTMDTAEAIQAKAYAFNFEVIVYLLSNCHSQ